MPALHERDRCAIYELYARSWAPATPMVFTEDAEATEETRDGDLEVRKGWEEIRKLVLKFHERPDFPGHQHQMSQFIFDPDPEGRPDHWVVCSYAWATINHSPAPPHLHWCGHIRDVVAKTAGLLPGWRLWHVLLSFPAFYRRRKSNACELSAPDNSCHATVTGKDSRS